MKLAAIPGLLDKLDKRRARQAEAQLLTTQSSHPDAFDELTYEDWQAIFDKDDGSDWPKDSKE